MIWLSTYHRRIAQLADALTTALSFAIAFVVWNWLRTSVPNTFGLEIKISLDLYWAVALFSVIWVIVFAELNAYTYQRFTSLQRETGLVAKTSILGTLLVFGLIFVLRIGYIPRTYVAVFFLFNFGCLISEKIIMFNIAKKVRESGRNRKRIIVVGNAAITSSFIKIVEANIGWGLDIVGVVSNSTADWESLYGEMVLGKLEEMEDILHNHQVDEVIICALAKEFGEVESVFDLCEREGVQVRLSSEFFGRLAKRITVDYVYGLPIISFILGPDNEWELYAKRAIDIVAGLVGLIVLSPAFLMIALLIKVTSPGPVFYRLKVVGFNKKPFTIWKFRTMMVNADALKSELMKYNEMSGPVFKIRSDPRITGVGRILRKYSIDELPQLWSVLKGDLSLVGPRAPGPHEFINYKSWHRRKLSIKPGLTCLWQVNGRNRIADFDQWCQLDLEYIDNWSLCLDFRILLRTIRTVLRGTGC
jgi:exopolysaccharide biosynthesis polyprenyl glycosylphosphotransferase